MRFLEQSRLSTNTEKYRKIYFPTGPRLHWKINFGLLEAIISLSQGYIQVSGAFKVHNKEGSHFWFSMPSVFQVALPSSRWSSVHCSLRRYPFFLSPGMVTLQQLSLSHFHAEITAALSWVWSFLRSCPTVSLDSDSTFSPPHLSPSVSQSSIQRTWHRPFHIDKQLSSLSFCFYSPNPGNFRKQEKLLLLRTPDIPSVPLYVSIPGFPLPWHYRYSGQIILCWWRLVL